MPPLLWHVLFERSLSLSLSLFLLSTRVVVVFVCVAFVLCFGLPKHTLIVRREKERKNKKRVDKSYTNPKL